MYGTTTARWTRGRDRTWTISDHAGTPRGWLQLDRRGRDGVGEMAGLPFRTEARGGAPHRISSLTPDGHHLVTAEAWPLVWRGSVTTSSGGRAPLALTTPGIRRELRVGERGAPVASLRLGVRSADVTCLDAVTAQDPTLLAVMLVVVLRRRITEQAT